MFIVLKYIFVLIYDMVLFSDGRLELRPTALHALLIAYAQLRRSRRSVIV